MSDQRRPFAPDHGPDFADEAAREQRHGVLIELLGAYVDGELPIETVSQIDAHLLGCARCRRDVAVQESLRGRLAVEPPAVASPALRNRIASALDAVPAPTLDPVTVGDVGDVGDVVVGDTAPRRHSLPWPARLGWGVALAIALLAGARQWSVRAASDVQTLAAPAASVPLFDAVLADYRRVTAGDLPGRARDLAAVRDAVPFPVEPLHAASLRLLAAWTTDLRGEPAAVLAYRQGDRVVVQYIVSDDAFFRDPRVRRAVAERHLLAASDGAQGLVAWPAAASGLLLVGDVSPRVLASVRAGEE
jgi:anti-sigma factor RsiW